MIRRREGSTSQTGLSRRQVLGAGLALAALPFTGRLSAGVAPALDERALAPELLETLAELVDVLLPPATDFVGGRACGAHLYIERLLALHPEAGHRAAYRSWLAELSARGFAEASPVGREALIGQLADASPAAASFLAEVVEHALEGIWYWPHRHSGGERTGLDLYRYDGPVAAASPPFGHYDRRLPSRFRDGPVASL